MDWSARQYLKFEDERTRPALDLLNAVPLVSPDHVVDLGCGPGNSTELLAERFPAARIMGLDSSPDMIATAQKRLPRVEFAVADLTTWQPEAAPDLIYANAVFQFVPDHATALPRVLSLLKPGGVMALQFPDNLDQPSHRTMMEVARNGPWAVKFSGIETVRTVVAPPRWYHDLLRPLAARVDLWHTVYQHPLAGTEAIVEWFKGTGLRPFLARLEPAEQEDYLARYNEGLKNHYPVNADGTVLLAFPRFFVVARK